MAPNVENHGVKIRGKKRQTFEKNAIECNRFDEFQFQSVKRQSKDLKDQEKEHKAKYPTFPDLHQDIFDALYKNVPRETPSRQMKPGWETNWEIIKGMLDDDTYKKLRSFTKLDEFNASLATLTLTKGVVDMLPDVKKMPRQRRKKGDPPDDPKQRKPDPKKLGKAIKDALQGASKECREMEEAVLSWGTGAGTAQRLTHSDKIKLAKRIHKSDKLRQLAKLVGRFKNLAISTQRTKVKKGAEEIYSVETGDNIDRMLDSELSLMSHPSLKLELYEKILKKEVLQFALRDRMKETKGPIVTCIDNSGSMSGEPEIWAKAVALGLLEICVLQRRQFAGIHFGSASETRVFTFDWNNYSVFQVIDFAEFFFGGGTDFERPLDLAAKVIDDDHPKADIVMISDGICDVSDGWLKEFIEWRDEKEVTVFSVIIDPYSHHSGSWKSHYEDTLKKFSNGMTIRAADIQEEGGMTNAGEIFNFV